MSETPMLIVGRMVVTEAGVGYEVIHMPDSLDAAWAEAEAAAEALAPGGGGPTFRRWAYDVTSPYHAVFRDHDAFGSTPAAALRALAEKLR